MTKQEFELDLSRRRLLAAAGIGGAVAVAASVIRTEGAEAARAARPAPDPVATPPVAGLHLQFGGDASSEIVVSWHTPARVHRPRVVLGRLDGKFEQTVDAETASYTDAKSGRAVYVHHAKLSHLDPDSSYLYGAMSRNSRVSAPRHAAAPRSPSRASATRARRRSAGNTGRRRG